MQNSTQYRYRLLVEIVDQDDHGEPVRRSEGVLDPEDEYVPVDDRTLSSVVEIRKANTRVAESIDAVRELLDRHGPIDRAFVWDRHDVMVRFAGSTLPSGGEPRVASMEVEGPDVAGLLVSRAKGTKEDLPRPTTRDRCDSCRGNFQPRERAYRWYLFDETRHILCRDCGEDVAENSEAPGLIDPEQWITVDDTPTDEWRRKMRGEGDA